MSPSSRSSTPPGASSSSSASTSSAWSRRTRTASLVSTAPASGRAPEIEGFVRPPLTKQTPELAQQRLVQAQVLVGHRVGQLPGQAPLLLAELARDDDVDHHTKVAVAPRAAQA